VVGLNSHRRHSEGGLEGAALVETEARIGQEMPHRVSSRELQDYVEGRLAKEHHARIADYLRENPEFAERVEKLRQQVRQMRKFGQALLNEDVPQRLMDAISRKGK
jgi:anti-sigma factor RsiW